ncbi:MAG: peptidylprolyl isomerase [Cognatishimia sp.]|uniref:peptidylprolyl isomerase n=1 Tax=Cognatishimia sp. TaxID=2211648 RepID=UPI003B8D5ACA
MSKTLNFLRGSAIALMLVTPAFADDSVNADTVVATVAGSDITVGHMLAVRAGLDPQYQSLPDDVLFNGILEQLVQQALLSSAFEGELPKRLQLELDTQATAMKATAAMSQLVEDKVDDAAIQEAYDARYANFEGTPEYNASHILVETEEEAKAIAEDIRGGADFAETAKAKSTGPSGPNGGQLGWFGPGQMVPAFEGAAAALEKGQVSDPVKTQFGWHVIILNDARQTSAPELASVRPQIEGELQRQIIEAELARLETEIEVDTAAAGDIDPAILKQTDLLEN